MKLNYVPLGPENIDIERNIKHAKALGLDYVKSGLGLGIPLAVVGGGPSINEHVDVLKNWPGDIWALNGAFQWCIGHKIDATFFSCDSNPTLAVLAAGAKRAILATYVDASVFEVLRDAQVRIFDSGFICGVHTGPTSATSVPALALHTGYGDVTFFGCESSYSEGKTHAYNDSAPNLWRVRVVCGGQEFDTEAEYHMQARYLADCIRTAPHVFKERSGGLLRAMIEHDDDDVTAASPELMAILRAA